MNLTRPDAPPWIDVPDPPAPLPPPDTQHEQLLHHAELLSELNREEASQLQQMLEVLRTGARR